LADLIAGVRELIKELMERAKARVGIYGTGWNPESVMGLLLPFLLVASLVLIGWFLVHALN
jgi:hypothetical protein